MSVLTRPLSKGLAEAKKHLLVNLYYWTIVQGGGDQDRRIPVRSHAHSAKAEITRKMRTTQRPCQTRRSDTTSALSGEERIIWTTPSNAITQKTLLQTHFHNGYRVRRVFWGDWALRLPKRVRHGGVARCDLLLRPQHAKFAANLSSQSV